MKSPRSEEHTSELQSRETISYAVFCLKKKKKKKKITKNKQNQALNLDKKKSKHEERNRKENGTAVRNYRRHT